MHLTTNDQHHTFIDIREFRALHDLPASFGVGYFEPKDFTGLASLEHGGAALNAVRTALLEALPMTATLADLMTLLSELGDLFREKLHEVNHVIHLKDVEIEYAAAGFSDVCQQWLYTLVRAQATQAELPDFPMIYRTWLSSTTRISQRGHEYIHNEEVWQVQIVNNAYGRVGLIVTTGEGTYTLRDASLACPAEGYMYTLLNEIITQLTAAME